MCQRVCVSSAWASHESLLMLPFVYMTMLLVLGRCDAYACDGFRVFCVVPVFRSFVRSIILWCERVLAGATAGVDVVCLTFPWVTFLQGGEISQSLRVLYVRVCAGLSDGDVAGCALGGVCPDPVVCLLVCHACSGYELFVLVSRTSLSCSRTTYCGRRGDADHEPTPGYVALAASTLLITVPSGFERFLPPSPRYFRAQ